VTLESVESEMKEKMELLPTKATPSSSLIPTRQKSKLDLIERNFVGMNVLSVKQFSREDLHILFNHAEEMKLMVRKTGNVGLLKGKVLATLFYEPSTRTCLSFTTAMQVKFLGNLMC
jgi:carbamoyl-phosphate synthase/aspartate carbamoyltransferase